MTNQVTICLLLQWRNVDVTKLAFGQCLTYASGIARIGFVYFVLLIVRYIGWVHHQTSDPQF